jgi:hypothetical protein
MRKFASPFGGQWAGADANANAIIKVVFMFINRVNVHCVIAVATPEQCNVDKFLRKGPKVPEPSRILGQETARVIDNYLLQ